MAKTDYRSVDQYLADQPPERRPALETVRAAIRRAAPQAVEGISYQIPAYRLHGQVLVYFAGWTQHFSLYPLTAAMQTAFAGELAPYELSKGTIRFPLDEPVPEALIERLVAFKAGEAAERAAAKASRRKAQ